jgi:hypothetical protein
VASFSLTPNSISGGFSAAFGARVCDGEPRRMIAICSLGVSSPSTIIDELFCVSI